MKGVPGVEDPADILAKHTDDGCCELEETVDVTFWDSMEGLLVWDMELGVGESVGN